MTQYCHARALETGSIKWDHVHKRSALNQRTQGET